MGQKYGMDSGSNEIVFLEVWILWMEHKLMAFHFLSGDSFSRDIFKRNTPTISGRADLNIMYVSSAVNEENVKTFLCNGDVYYALSRRRSIS